ncbi:MULTISPECIES: hypothetical protein [unclassified Ruegeria]|uniref:hypothetical protein n=1 Tax=unclassified Ruegeria TaxID=2625375 RepID=UPI00148988DA|nr:MULTISPECIES: hypothetical protein [unclassified Ruegeria]NOD75970.1 hypothetical protein [Ruegeria sp. HKCCD4332]NOD88751.1 hypothetical protein [Ruegeria sp. HKCCD4318]NOE16146.1 hypothetical protein [Ruegeria sp. HKCCD4318-2]NOG09815.1 hypothetical protein [Ruegeria sp. HKCCD4315]
MRVIIHAGAAFADEGHILSSLVANRQMLAEMKTAPMGPRMSRHFVKIMSDALIHGTSIEETRDSLAPLFPQDVNLERVILSSDKFFGPRRTALQHGQIYPFAGRRAAFTETLLEGAQLELFIGLVNPGLFIPKTLMSIHEDHRRDILASTDLSCLSWLSMIEDLRELAPQFKLTVWENENLPLIWGDIVRAMTGLPSETPLPDEYSFLTSLLTDAGQRQVQEILGQRTPLDLQGQREELAQVLEDQARPEQVEEELDLPGWSTDIFDAFTELYAQDMAAIRTMSDIRVL